MRTVVETTSCGFTGEYFRLVDAGLLAADDRVELLEGLIVAMSPQNPRHASATTRALRALDRVIQDRAVMRVQSPLAAIYAAAGIPEYWVINLRDDCVEVLRAPDRTTSRYVSRRVAGREECIALVVFPDAWVRVDDLMSS